ncbi:MAG: pentapeptide repeat-containing protein [Cyanobacteria bacterium P01_H01_bin.105]
MANAKHLGLLKRGVKEWNQWREDSPEIKPDLSSASLNGADLNHINLSDADLSDTELFDVDLSGANLCGTLFYAADLRLANLSGANLSGAFLHDSDLSDADLSSCHLYRANLHWANLQGTNLNKADLTNADLSYSSALNTSFKQSVLTGAFLQDWNINSETMFDDVSCDYIYFKSDGTERRPRDSKDNFKPGEFAALFQQVVDTVDLIFKDGIDWQAFFQSFQDLRSQYAGQDLAIQAIEKKRGGAFVVRVEVPPEIDKTVIEIRVKELYASEVKTLEAQYEERFRLQGQHLEDARQTIEIERREKATLMGVMTTMANSQQGPKYDMRGAQFAGGFAETVQGDQVGGTINNYGPNTEDITRLLTALRDQAQTFPTDQKDEANDVLDDLERDLADEQPDQGRIGRRLKKLVAIATTLTIGATAFTADLAQLADVLNVPLPQIEQVQPEQLPPSGTP